jgi:hypothetical protein
VSKQGAWGLWWLVYLTLGVYYYVWYHRINRELVEVTGEQYDATCQWWSQLIPFYNFYALAKTAQRLNRAHAQMDSPTRVSVFVAWFWAPSWFISQTRYLQRRVNILHDVQASRHSYVASQAMSAPRGDATKQLSRLAKLRDEGVLTDEEFQAKKTDLLGRM